MDPEWNDSQPIYRQIRDRVVAMILDGLLKEGDPLPSVRNVAVTYLGIVRDSPEKEVAGLITALSDGEASVRQAAAIALAAYGAQAEWNPGKQTLVCPFCGTESPYTIDRETGKVTERDLVTALRELPEDERGWQAAQRLESEVVPRAPAVLGGGREGCRHRANRGAADAAKAVRTRDLDDRPLRRIGGVARQQRRIEGAGASEKAQTIGVVETDHALAPARAGADELA